jgi:GGDEF domain-containing protein
VGSRGRRQGPRQAAQVLQTQIRSGDAAGRLGGDEFLLLLKDASIGEAENICDRIRTALRQNSIAMDGKTQIMLTLSCGIASSRTADTFGPLPARRQGPLHGEIRRPQHGALDRLKAGIKPS